MNKFLTNKEDITDWLDKYQVENYTLIPDDKYGYVVDVHDNVDLYDKKLYFLPIKFNTVSGYFSCYNNQLTSLLGSPEEVGGYFSCDNNSALGELQEIIDFPIIYQEFKKINIKKLADKIDQELDISITNNLKRIKI